MNEYSLLKAIRIYGLERIVQKAAEMRAAGWKIGAVEGGELAQVVEGRQCGYFLDKEIPCVCTEGRVRGYFSKIAGPIQDRIDIEVLLGRVPYRDLLETGGGEPSEAIRNRVMKAREHQARRFEGSTTAYNSRMTNREVREHCRLDGDSEKLMETAMKKINLSARSFFRVLKVSRTIADLAGSIRIEKAHLLESLSYKNLYRLYNMQ